MCWRLKDSRGLWYHLSTSHFIRLGFSLQFRVLTLPEQDPRLRRLDRNESQPHIA